MASGHVHNTASVAIGITGATVIYSTTKDMHTALSWCAWSFAGMFLTPDLDQETLNRMEWNIVKLTLGFGFIWIMIWYPYALLFPHRHPLSHWPGISTVIRLLYLVVAVFGLVYVFCWMRGDYSYLDTYTESVLYIAEITRWGILGLFASDTVHFVTDVLSTSRKRGKRNRRN